MLTINARARIGDYEFPYVKSVEISSSYENLTDTCEITVPRKVVHEGQIITNGESLFAVGDKVTVTAGYDGNTEVIFSGYVARIKPHANITFSCEDPMWLMKQKSYTFSGKNETLKSVLSRISPTPYEAIDANLGRIRFSDRTGAYILKELRDTYGLYSWFRAGVLYSGLAYRVEGRKGAKMVFSENIINPDDLWFRKKEDIKLNIKAISIKPDNTKEEISFGDPEGEVRTIHLYNVSKADLQSRAQAEIDRIQRDGWTGQIKTLGQPTLRHGDVVSLVDNTNPDRNGKYLVKSIDYSINTDTGFLQTLHLGNQI